MQWTCKFPSLEPWGWGSTSVNCFWGLSQALSQCWWSVTVNSLLHIDLSPVGFTSASCRLLQMLPTSSAALEGPLLSGRIKLSFLIHSCLQVLGNHNPAPSWCRQFNSQIPLFVNFWFSVFFGGDREFLKITPTSYEVNSATKSVITPHPSQWQMLKPKVK